MLIRMPWYIYHWLRLLKSVRSSKFDLAKYHIRKLEPYDEGRRYEFHLYQAQIKFALEEYEGCAQDTIHASRLIVSSTRINQDEKRYLIVYCEKYMARLEDRCTTRTLTQRTLVRKLEKARNDLAIPSLERENINPRILQNYPI